jgi:hypothetical protein
MSETGYLSAEQLPRAVLRVASVLLLHWSVGAALTLAARPVGFDVLAWWCPVAAIGWLAPVVAPRALLGRRRAAARGLDLASGATLALLVLAASATWLARGAGWPPFLSPIEFGERWARSFG